MRNALLCSAAVLSVLGCVPSTNGGDFTLPSQDQAISPVGVVKGALDTSDSDGAISPDEQPVGLRDAAGGGPTTLTVKGGAFVFSQVPTGTYQLTHRVFGFEALALEVKVEGGQTVDLGTLKLKWAIKSKQATFPTLKGKVILGKGITGAAGDPRDARVEFLVNDSRIDVAVVGDDGSFVKSVPPGKYVLVARHPLYKGAVRSDVVTAGEGEQVTVKDLELLANPATLRVEVQEERETTDATGKLTLARVPSAGATVTVGAIAPALTDAAGIATLGALLGAPVQLAVTKQGCHAAPISAALAPGGNVTVKVLLLLDRGTITGQVSLKDKSPLDRAAVVVSGTGYSASIAADPSGKDPSSAPFQIVGVPVGTYSVVAVKDRFAPRTAPVTLLGDGAAVDVGVLELVRTTGDFDIDDGDNGNTPGFTRTRGVTLTFKNVSNVKCVRISETEAAILSGAATCNTFSGAPVPFQLAAGADAGGQDGVRTVYAQYEDATTGARSQVFSSSVVLDTVKPGAPVVALEGGARFTRSGLDLALTIDAIDTGGAAASGIARMRIAETSAALATSAALPYGRSTTFRRSSSADGNVKLWVRVEDNAGNASPVDLLVESASIVVDTQPPTGSFAIAPGASSEAGYTSSALVDLTSSVNPESNGGPVFMRVAASKGELDLAPRQLVYSGCGTASCPSASKWSLDGTSQGRKTVWARFEDLAGNQTLAQSSDVTFDSVAPTVTVTLKSGATVSNQLRQTLVVRATDAVGLAALPVFLSADSDIGFSGATAVALPTNAEVDATLPAGDGPRRINVRVRDHAGNDTIASVALRIDTEPPVATLTVGDGSGFTNASTVPLLLRNVSLDATQVFTWADAAATTAPTCDASTPMAPLTASLTATLPTSSGPSGTKVYEGAKSVVVCLRDAAGNVTRLPPVAVLYDVTPPAATMTLNGGSPTRVSSRSLSVTVALGAADPSGVPTMALGDESNLVTQARPEPFRANFQGTLTSGDGQKTFVVRLFDGAGNSVDLSRTVTLDSTSPTLSVALKSPSVTNSRQVTLTVTGQDTVGLDPAPLTLSEDPSFSSATPQGLAAGAAVDVVFPLTSAGDGTKTIFARLRDSVGNDRIFSVQVQLDTTAPRAAALLLEGGSAATRSTSISAVLTAADLDVQSVSELVESAGTATTASCATATYVAYAPPLKPTLGGVDEAKRVSYCLRDAAGNVGGPFAATILLDRAGPTGSITLSPNGGGAINPVATAVPDVIIGLALSPPDLSGPTAVAFGDDARPLSSAPFEPYVPSRAWRLSAGDGTKTVSARVRDAAGNTADFTRSVVLDTQPPSGTITLNGGAQYVRAGDPLTLAATFTTTEPVTLAYQAYQATVSTTPPDPCQGTFGALPAGPVTVSPAPTGDGVWAVAACWKDAAGNLFRTTRFITVDQTRPEGTASLNSGAATTTSSAVLLAYFTPRSPDVTQMAVSTAPIADCATATYESFVPSQSKTLLAPTGTKSFSVCFKDAAGNVSAAATPASIYWDPDAPTGSMTLTGVLGPRATGSASLLSTSRQITVAFTLSDATSTDSSTFRLALSDTPIPATATGGPYQSSVIWTVPPGDGPKPLYARIFDPAGNTLSLTQSITLDTVAPSAPTLVLHDDVGAGAPFEDNGSTNLTAVKVDLNASGAVGYEVSEDSAFTPAATTTAAGISFPQPGVSFAIAATAGAHTVLARYFDAAGNVSAAVSQGVAFSTSAPSAPQLSFNVPSLATATPAFATPGGAITANLIASGATFLKFTGADVSSSQTYVPYAASAPLTLTPCPVAPPSECTRNVTVTVANAAGNTASATAAIKLDTLAPAGMAIALNGGALFTNSSVATVTFSGIAANSDITAFRLSNDSSFSTSAFAPFTPPGAAVSWDLGGTEGPRTVYAQFRDLAGNVSLTASAGITFDQTPPTWTNPLTVVSSFINTASVTLAYDLVDNLDLPSSLSVFFAQTPGSCAAVPAASFKPYGTVTYPLSPSADGTYTIYACVKDRAGNFAPALGSWPQVVKDTTAPSLPLMNLPVPLASGMELSWTDLNSDSLYAEIDYSLDPTFAAKATAQSSRGKCGIGGARQAPPTTVRLLPPLIAQPLDNYRNWYFRVRLFDCAGNPTPGYAPAVTGVPNVGTHPFQDADSGSVRLYSEGSDLWAHYPAGDGVHEWVGHCIASSDCRLSSNWNMTLVTLTSTDYTFTDPPAMFSDGDTLFLAQTVTNGTFHRLTLASAPRASSDLGSSWSYSNLRDTNNPPAATFLGLPAAVATAKRLFIVYPRITGGQQKLSVARCPRTSPGGCKTPAEWANSEFDLHVDASPGARVTAGGTETLYIGFRTLQGEGRNNPTPAPGSEEFNLPNGAGEPGWATCSGNCSNVGGGACQDSGGYSCGDLSFGRLNYYGSSLISGDSLPPLLQEISGSVLMTFASRNAAASTESVYFRRCTSNCYFLGNAGPIIALFANRASPAGPRANLTLNTVGSGNSSATVYVGYPERGASALWISACNLGSGCTSAAGGVYPNGSPLAGEQNLPSTSPQPGWTVTKLASGYGSEVTASATAVGQNIFLGSGGFNGRGLIYTPLIAAPNDFVVGPRVGGLEFLWRAAESSSGTRIFYQPGAPPAPNGVWAASVATGDPFTSRFQLSPTGTGIVFSGAVQSVGAMGIGEAAEPWRSAAYGLGAAVNPTALEPVASAISLASAPKIAGSTGAVTVDQTIYAAHLSAGDVRLGRCNPVATSCDQAGDWSWNVLNAFGGWNTLQLSVDYPRDWNDGRVLAGARPLIWMAGRYSTSSVYFRGCDLASSPCSSASDFALAGSIGSTPSPAVLNTTLRSVGPFVMTTEATSTGAALVRYCDAGAPFRAVPGTPDAVRGVELYTNLKDAPQASSYCLDPTRWKSSPALGTGGKWTAGVPHPWGWVAAQSTANGISLWMCQRSPLYNGGLLGCASSANCPAPDVCGGSYCQPGPARNPQVYLRAVDCTQAANWKELRIPGGAYPTALDLTISTVAVAPLTGITVDSEGIFLSYFDRGWRVASCRGLGDGGGWGCSDATPYPPAPAAPTYNLAGSWSSTLVAPSGNVPVSSTIRSISGDLVALLQETGRAMTAICPGGVGCSKASSWRVVTSTSTQVAATQQGQGFLTGDASGNLFGAYVNGSGTPAMNILAKGAFRGP